jgi:hypothetical protein
MGEGSLLGKIMRLLGSMWGLWGILRELECRDDAIENGEMPYAV